VQSNIVLLTQAFRKKFVIPDFPAFAGHIDELYESAKKLDEGQVCWAVTSDLSRMNHKNVAVFKSQSHGFCISLSLSRSLFMMCVW